MKNLKEIKNELASLGNRDDQMEKRISDMEDISRNEVDGGRDLRV